MAAAKKSSSNRRNPDNLKPFFDGVPPKEFGVDGQKEMIQKRVNQNFLDYASYVIRDRAIPHLDDGLKPVQRRIMWVLKKMDDGKFNKVSNVTGNCMAFHPHGDASINDALIVLVNKSYLIEGQGNFGNIYTGDRAAAARYIECRLTDLAREELFQDELTEFVPRYDGRDKEPVTLPAKLPVLLMLGAEGIAVGLSARILPHNFIELLQAQIAILQKKPFSIVPDFPKGALMDASMYDDGRGSVKVRARIDIEDASTLVIREIPQSSTSDSIITSIEDAAKKGKIKIKSINDFTSKQIEIELKLAPGIDAEKTVQALYAFTECETSISSRIVVIDGDRPAELSVSEVLQRNTQRLLELHEKELKIREGKLLEDIYFRTIVRIFIEERIYKKIESAKTSEEVTANVYKGFKPFEKDLWRPLVDDDIELLLKVPIRRISLFDINKHKQELEKIQADLADTQKHLKNVVKYAISHLDGLIKKYKDQYPRLTQITSFESVTAKEVVHRAFKMGYDREKGYLGFKVNGEEFQFAVSQLDKVVIVTGDGQFRVSQVEEKAFVGNDVLYVSPAAKEKEMLVVYNLDNMSYVKRFQFGGTILNKIYRFVPEKSKILYFNEFLDGALYIKYAPSPKQKINEQFLLTQDLRVRSAKAGGNQISIKKIKSVTDSKPRGWDQTGATRIKLA
ncbi:MAG: DNA topoisomerase IV subunit A [Verrucomicrobia bacterium]|nr:DNA topoisomerase IV subunit A [Verrucomicrobiota bacterium]